jgi:hypothetical protein
MRTTCPSLTPVSGLQPPAFFQWAGRRSNPRLRFFRPPLHRLSYQPKIVWELWRATREATKKGPASH